LLKLERPHITADKMRELARKDWDVLDLFYWHVETVDLDGNRELWSPTFVGFVWEYWQRSGFGDHVRQSEINLEGLASSENCEGLIPDGLSGGLFPRKAVEWPKPHWKKPTLTIPADIFHIDSQPELPPLPRRFQHNLPYKEGPLEHSLAKALDGTEAWDAMLGTSDRLQGAARSMLRQESRAAAIVRIGVEAEEKILADIEAERQAEERAFRERQRQFEAEELARNTKRYRTRALGDLDELRQSRKVAQPKRRQSVSKDKTRRMSQGGGTEGLA